MAKIKLTKTELKAQTDALKRFSRFLPMLQLKKQQLQGEIAGIAQKAEEVAAKERQARAQLHAWAGLLATDPKMLEGLVRVRQVNTSEANIAGVPIPVFESVEIETAERDLWATPAWADDAVAAFRQIVAFACEREVLDEQRARVTRELTATAQRVNLFEKVKIPQCKENIRVIKIALGDEQTAAVTRGKIAKGRAA